MKITEKGLTLNVHLDSSPESPRDDESNAGTMVCWHSRYSLGDEHHYESPKDFLSKEGQKAYVILPLYLYEHSALSISTESFIGRAVHAEFDSGQVGFIYISSDQVKAKTGLEPTEENKEQVKNILESEVEIYDQYLNGDAYSFEITDQDGELIVGGERYYADSLKDAVSEMKECCWEYDFLFAKMQEQCEKEYTAG